MSASKPELDWAPLLPPTVVRPQVALAAPSKFFHRHSHTTTNAQPSASLNVCVDGRETSYFEWLGAGIYSENQRTAEMPGVQLLHELHYGFGERFFYLRADAFPGSLSLLRDLEFRISLHGTGELRLQVAIEHGVLAGCLFNTADVCILGTHELVQVAFDRILEVAIGRRLFSNLEADSLSLSISLWRDEVQLERLPHDTAVDIKLGEEAFAWPAEPSRHAHG